ncbi:MULTISPECIES: hypothetical protein [Acinetobacter]|uniref:hypothetical protein n=1 Tax=Acinetobacter TaxID=469 RepID=UPI001F20B16F|nr:hypothetical protein [Acinetobacter johnsonii]UJA00439.1 hypothetical protein GBN93_05450 [Acinetobacter johnsonii]
MNQSSTNTQNNPLIKSWFGFFLGLIAVGLSINGLSESFTLSRVLSTLGFLFFWYPWTQITWNQSIKDLIQVNSQSISKSCLYLGLIALILFLSSVFVRLL